MRSSAVGCPLLLLTACAGATRAAAGPVPSPPPPAAATVASSTVPAGAAGPVPEVTLTAVPRGDWAVGWSAVEEVTGDYMGAVMKHRRPAPGARRVVLDGAAWTARKGPFFRESSPDAELDPTLAPPSADAADVPIVLAPGEIRVFGVDEEEPASLFFVPAPAPAVRVYWTPAAQVTSATFRVENGKPKHEQTVKARRSELIVEALAPGDAKIVLRRVGGDRTLEVRVSSSRSE